MGVLAEMMGVLVEMMGVLVEMMGVLVEMMGVLVEMMGVLVGKSRQHHIGFVPEEFFSLPPLSVSMHAR